MIAVIFFLATMVLGMIAIGILEPFMKPLGLPRDVGQALFIGAGALFTMPFVLSVLAEAHVSILASLVVGAVLLVHAGGAFGYAMLRLAMPLARVPFSKRR